MSNGSFRINFSVPVAAVGFFMTDYGDSAACTSLSSLTFVASLNGSPAMTFNAGYSNSGTMDGGVLYIGLFSGQSQFNRIVLTTVCNDPVGIDQLTAFTVNQLK
jgi:hypothetical protein